MKYTGVRPWIVDVGAAQSDRATARRVVRPLVFVEVSTDEGITGWGEITTYPGSVANKAVAGMVRDAAELVIGEDPSRIEALWNKVFRQFTYVGTRGAVSALGSGIDIAPWAIRGTALGQRAYKRLGGEVRDRIAHYTHPPGYDAPCRVAAAAGAALAGALEVGA